MQRTQVYFEDGTLEILREEARKRRTTLAAVIREKVEKNTRKRSKNQIKKEKNAAKILLEIARLGEKLRVKGPKDLSQKVDEFVYKYPNPTGK